LTNGVRNMVSISELYVEYNAMPKKSYDFLAKKYGLHRSKVVQDLALFRVVICTKTLLATLIRIAEPDEIQNVEYQALNFLNEWVDKQELRATKDD